MKKKYIAPNIKYAANGSLEGVFAATNRAGYEYITRDSGQICKNYSISNWMISTETNNLYDDDFEHEEEVDF